MLTNPSPTPSPVAGLGVRLLEEFRRINPKFSIQWASAFMFVASRPGCRVSDIAEHLGVSSSAASMILLALSEKGTDPAKGGLGLLEATQAADDYRSKEVRLTAKGRACLAAMQAFHDYSCRG